MDDLAKYRLDSAKEKLMSAKLLLDARQYRNCCDYDDFYIVSQKDAVEQYQRAEELLRVITEFIEKE